MKPLAIALLLFAVEAIAQDPLRGRCSADIEDRVDDCTSGLKDSWYYTFQGKGQSAPVPSWPYKSRERAQAALDSDRSICQKVDRYFDHTDCQTTYGGVFCAACQGDPGLDWMNTDLKQATLKDIELWDGQMIAALLRLRNVEQTGVPGSNSSFGGVLKDYIEQLKAARQRVIAFEKLMARPSRQLQELAAQLDRVTAQLETVRLTSQKLGPTPPEPSGVKAPASPVVALSAQCAAKIPSWTPACDQAVDALFAKAKTAGPDEIPCLRDWRAYHQCLGVYAHDSRPDPAPKCVVPSCSIKP